MLGYFIAKFSNNRGNTCLFLTSGTPETNLRPGPSSSKVSGIQSPCPSVEAQWPKSKKQKRCR